MKEKQLKDRLKMIELSPVSEPVHMGEIAIAMNVLERVKHHAPEVYSRVLKQLEDK